MDALSLGERAAAACGALYVALLVGGDDFINPAGEVPGPNDSVRDFTAYVEAADTTRFWLGRSIGLLGLCALLVFVAFLASRIRASGGTRLLSGLCLTSGALAVTLQFLAAPPVFAAVQAGDSIDPEVTRALVLANSSFGLSFMPLGVFLGCVAAAGWSSGVLPRWLSVIAAALAVALVAGLIGQPQEPSVVAFFGFALSLLWFVTASVVLLVQDARGRRRTHEAAEG